MRINAIFLDLDDVLNTLTPHLMVWAGAQSDPLDYSNYPGSMELHRAVNRARSYGPRYPYTKEVFWRSIPREVWATTPPSPDLNWLLKTCRRLVGRQVFLATTAQDTADCLAGKLDWIHNFLPSWLHKQCIFIQAKAFLACKGRLLIDDNEMNCRRFQGHGGLAIRYPRPWNQAAGCKPREYIEENLGIVQSKTA
jgi:5'(3')-deoxyribonucleotidase